ncbi:MAG: NlpC/P60 family protein [Paludibacteraceae bacterium]|nr:NlpC/P60 family protein [Paludibacteraceae bacterium]
MTRFLFILFANLFLFSSVCAETLIQGKPNYNNIDEWLVFGQKHLRRAYRMGGAGPYAFDCSGFTMYMFKELGISLPHNSVEQSKIGEKVSQKHAEKGDLVFYAGSKGSSIGHVGIIYEVNSDETFTFIHASTSQGVIIDSSEHSYYKSRFKQIRRITTNEEIADALGIKRRKNSSKQDSEEKKEHNRGKEEKEQVAQDEPSVNNEIIPEPSKDEQHIDKQRGAKKGLKGRLKRKNKRNKEVVNDEPKNDGNVVVVPEKKDTSIVVEPVEDTIAVTKHIVAKGETLYAISRKYGVSVEDIKQWNGMKDNALSIGKELIIKK